jgi:hypothetical protein
MSLHSFLSYDPDLDRLVGGDSYREMQGVPIRLTLLSARHAERLVQDMRAFGQAYDKEFQLTDDAKRPYPRPLAVIELKEFPANVRGEEEIVPIDELFTADPLTIAPAEYRQLAQLVAIIPDRDSAEMGKPGPGSELVAFGRQLFRLIRCAHRVMGASLSRGSGSCLELEDLTPRGELKDLYFLTGGDQVRPTSLRGRWQADIRHAAEVLTRLGGGKRRRLVAAFDEALAVYAGSKPVTSEIRRLARSIAEQGGSRLGRESSEAIERLAKGVVASYVCGT